MKIITTILLVIAGVTLAADNSSMEKRKSGPDSKSNFVDPWGNTYQSVLDYEKILDKAPLLDAPGPGYPGRGIRGIDIVSAEPSHPGKGIQLDLYSTPTFSIPPSKSNWVDPWSEELRCPRALPPKKFPLLDAPGPGYRGTRGIDESFY